MENDRHELLEIYKIHAELADRVSQRREGANRLYVSLLTGILVLLVAVLRDGTEGIHVRAVMAIGGASGILLSASWFIVIRSYRQLNSGKFKALHELECRLEYPFFKREWKFLKQGGKRRIYWKISVVETFLPIGFLLCSVVVFLFSISSQF